MKSLSWFALALFVAAPLYLASSAGCGSEESAPAAPTTDGGPDGSSTTSGSCDPTKTPCTPPVVGASGTSACGGADAACSTNLQCCTLSCVSGKCSGKQCTADNGKCAADGECCGGKCTNGACAPLNATCKTLGNTCASAAECCGKLCTSGVCAAPSFCGQNGDTCSADLDCCGGACTKAAGATLGTCGIVTAPGAGGCTPAGQACTAPASGSGLPECGGDCCSRSCRPYAPTGAYVCQPPSGCHPTGELCQTDNDCCGAPGAPGSTKSGGGGKTTDVHCSKDPGATLGRCAQGNACAPAGAICRLATNSCNATDECCAGTVQTHPLNCKQDSLGIPRCTAASDVDCSKGAPPAGTACATSADCCGAPCVPNPAGGQPAFVCSATACVPSGGACTTTADCCAGSPCNIAAGATKGTCGQSGVGGGGTSSSSGGTGSSSSGGLPPGSTACAQYGQQCKAAGDCCDGVPCTLGYCQYPGPN